VSIILLFLHKILQNYLKLSNASSPQTQI
jgi:hypothetical protein